MNRIKFVVFALAALALWGGHFWLVSGSAGADAEEQAYARLKALEPAVMKEVEAEKVDLLQYASAAAANGEVAALLELAPPDGAAAPDAGAQEAAPAAAERFELLRSKLQALAPEGRRDDLLVAWKANDQVFIARGAGAPVGEGLDFSALEALGTAAASVTALGEQWEVRPVARHATQACQCRTELMDQPLYRRALAARGTSGLYVGFLEHAPDLDQVARATGLVGVALIRDDKAVARGGEEGLKLVELLGDLPKDGDPLIIERGSHAALGPAKLPVLTSGDLLGGQAPLRAAVRTKLKGTPWQVAALAPVNGLAHFADVQKLGLLGLLGLLVLAVVWTFLINNDGGDVGGISMPQPKAPPPPMGMRRNSGIESLSLTALGAAASPPPPPAEPSVVVSPSVAMPAARKSTVEQPVVVAPPVDVAAPEASPDDFDLPFGATTVTPPVEPPPPAPAPAPAARAPVAAAPPPPPPAPAEPPPPPAFAAGFSGDKLALPPPRRAGDHETRPRIVLPPEYQQKLAEERAAEAAAAAAAAAAPAPELPPAPEPDLDAAAALAAAAASVEDGPNPDDPEEVHWHEVFLELKAKKRELGEADDTHSWEKFRTKLETTRNQVVQKFGSRGVRFSVQVKDGKAGLKAAPIK